MLFLIFTGMYVFYLLFEFIYVVFFIQKNVSGSHD